MLLIWIFRLALVTTFILGLIVSAGCARLPECRIACVHIPAPPAKPTADLVLRYSGREIGVVVEVERIARETGD